MYSVSLISCYVSYSGHGIIMNDYTERLTSKSR